MKSLTITTLSASLLITGCGITNQYKDVDKTTSAKITVIGTKKLSNISICQPGRKGTAYAYNAFHVEADVPTYIYFSEALSYSRTKACKLTAVFKPKKSTSYYLDGHTFDNQCFLSISGTLPFVKSKDDLANYHLVKQRNNGSCKEVESGKKDADYIDSKLHYYKNLRSIR